MIHVHPLCKSAEQSVLFPVYLVSVLVLVSLARFVFL